MASKGRFALFLFFSHLWERGREQGRGMYGIEKRKVERREIREW